MEAKEMILGRRTIRQFKDEKINRDILKEVVKTASFSPSWMNKQIARYTVIDDAALKEEFAKAAFGDFKHNVDNVVGAVGVIVISYVTGISGHDPKGNIATSKGDSWAMFDAGIAAQTISLALYEKGIGSVILGVFDDQKAGEFLDLPDNEIVATIIPYGYPANETTAVPPRKSVDEILRFK